MGFLSDVASVVGTIGGMSGPGLSDPWSGAKNSVQWRVADAKAAGIHPLAALGANLTSPSPMYVGEQTPNFGDLGQSIGRAADSFLDARTRSKLDAEQASQAAREAARADEQHTLDMEYKREQIRALKQDSALQLANASERASGTQQRGPAFGSPQLVPGQNGSFPVPGTSVVPSEIVASTGGDTEAGFHPDRRFQTWTDANGRTYYDPIVGTSGEEGYESDELGGIGWQVRNRLLPNLSSSYFRPPSDVAVPSGYHWTYSPLDGYSLVPNSTYSRLMGISD